MSEQLFFAPPAGRRATDPCERFKSDGTAWFYIDEAKRSQINTWARASTGCTGFRNVLAHGTPADLDAAGGARFMANSKTFYAMGKGLEIALEHNNTAVAAVLVRLGARLYMSLLFRVLNGDASSSADATTCTSNGVMVPAESAGVPQSAKRLKPDTVDGARLRYYRGICDAMAVECMHGGDFCVDSWYRHFQVSADTHRRSGRSLLSFAAPSIKRLLAKNDATGYLWILACIPENIVPLWLPSPFVSGAELCGPATYAFVASFPHISGPRMMSHTASPRATGLAKQRKRFPDAHDDAIKELLGDIAEFAQFEDTPIHAFFWRVFVTPDTYGFGESVFPLVDAVAAQLGWDGLTSSDGTPDGDRAAGRENVAALAKADSIVRRNGRFLKYAEYHGFSFADLNSIANAAAAVANRAAAAARAAAKRDAAKNDAATGDDTAPRSPTGANEDTKRLAKMFLADAVARHKGSDDDEGDDDLPNDKLVDSLVASVMRCDGAADIEANPIYRQLMAKIASGGDDGPETHQVPQKLVPEMASCGVDEKRRREFMLSMTRPASTELFGVYGGGTSSIESGAMDAADSEEDLDTAVD